MMDLQSQSLPDEALVSIVSVLEPSKAPVWAAGDSDALFAVCQIAGEAAGISLIKPPSGIESASINAAIEHIARTSSCRVRKVTLTDINWEHQDCGPLIAFKKSDGEPCALLPAKKEGYVIMTPGVEKSERLTKDNQEALADEAYMLYGALPDTKLTWKDILKFSLRKRRDDFRRLISMQIFMGLLGLFIPIATGVLFDQVIPNADRSLLMHFIAGLTVNAFVISLFTISQVLVSIRIRLKINASLQAAVWDRLLRLPLNFFRQFTAGDLATRASGIDSIQQMMTSSVLLGIVSGFLSVITLFLLFYYDWRLALGAVLLVLFLSVIAIIGNLFQLKYLRRYLYNHGRLTGLVLQFLTSISKLRIANSESNAFLLWTNRFTKKNQDLKNAGDVAVNLSTFNAFFSVFSTLILFAMVYLRGDNLSFGSFIAFNAAFGQFFAAVLSLTGLITGILRIIPTYERVKPILNAEPEVVQSGVDPGELSGRVEVSHVNFRYDEKSNLLFNDFSLNVAPGEFIVIKGPSGCGKSTLFRLLLGLEKPEAGFISYDKHDLNSLNLELIRSQFGTVLQSNYLSPGSLLDNIIGLHSDLTLEDAWEAAESVGLAEDIRDMPMRMQTIITASGRTFSVGQRQRVLLAQAIVRKPKILLLDEATSALDNKTLELVFNHLKKMNITRLLATHQEASIRQADRVIELNQQ